VKRWDYNPEKRLMKLTDREEGSTKSPNRSFNFLLFTQNSTILKIQKQIEFLIFAFSFKSEISTKTHTFLVLPDLQIPKNVYSILIMGMGCKNGGL